MPRPTFFNLPEDKRARVVEALKAEFAARPYARASVDRVIAAAGVSKGSFYQYFENKDDAYAHLVRELMSARVGLTGAPAPDAPFEEVLAAIVRGSRDFHRSTTSGPSGGPCAWCRPGREPGGPGPTGSGSQPRWSREPGGSSPAAAVRGARRRSSPSANVRRQIGRAHV